MQSDAFVSSDVVVGINDRCVPEFHGSEEYGRWGMRDLGPRPTWSLNSPGGLLILPWNHQLSNDCQLLSSLMNGYELSQSSKLGVSGCDGEGLKGVMCDVGV